MCVHNFLSVKRLLVSVLGFLALSACSNYAREPVSSTRFLLGTTCTVTLYDAPPEGIFERVFGRIAEIDARMSANREDSELSAVNRAAGERPVRVSADTFTVIARGLEFARLSGGAFDITVGPLVRLWGIGTDRARVPSAEEIRRAQALLGWQDVVLDRAASTVFLERAGMSLDLGGIAKGYAADETTRLLNAAGLKRAIIALGGNIYAMGRKSGGTPWRIGIQDPEDQRGDSMAVLEVEDRTVVTSGTYERFFERDGVRYHHILDPAAGQPARSGLSSVTIVSRDSTAADALSTSVFVLGAQRGLALLRELPGVEAVLLTEDHRLYTTAGLRGRVRLTNYAYREEAAPGSP